MKRIGMVVALEEEILPLLQNIDVKINRKEAGKFSVAEFTLGDKEIITVKSGVGEIKGAAATQYLITEYNPDMIINFGVCGSLSSGLSLKSVVLVSGVVHYDFDTSAVDDCVVGKYEDYPDVVIKTNENLLNLAERFFVDANAVICASADKFVADPLQKKLLSETYGASVCDMESAGVLITADMNDTPTLIVKAVSDGDGGAAEYRALVKDAARQYIDFLLKFAKIV